MMPAVRAAEPGRDHDGTLGGMLASPLEVAAEPGRDDEGSPGGAGAAEPGRDGTGTRVRAAAIGTRSGGVAMPPSSLRGGRGGLTLITCHSRASASWSGSTPVGVASRVGVGTMRRAALGGRDASTGGAAASSSAAA